MTQVIEAVYENGVIKPLSTIKENVLIVLVLNKKRENKVKNILNYAGILKNVDEDEIQKILEEIESGENFY